MNYILRYCMVAAAAYLTGSLNGSLMMSRFLLRDDIRKHGSGNAGATNVLRTYGIRWTILVAIWDIGKGVLAVLLGRWVTGWNGLFAYYGLLIAGIFVIIGHVFPLFFAFKGGKGVFTALAVMMTLDWQVASVSFALFILIVILSRYISLGSVCAVCVLVPLGLAFGREWPSVAMYGSVALLIVFLHRANIKRLLAGTENKLSRGKNKP